MTCDVVAIRESRSWHNGKESSHNYSARFSQLNSVKAKGRYTCLKLTVSCYRFQIMISQSVTGQCCSYNGQWIMLVYYEYKTSLILKKCWQIKRQRFD